MTDFSVVRQPSRPKSCISFGFFRCPPTILPYVRHRLSDFMCQPHKQNDVRFPISIICNFCFLVNEQNITFLYKCLFFSSCCHLIHPLPAKLHPACHMRICKPFLIRLCHLICSQRQSMFPKGIHMILKGNFIF